MPKNLALSGDEQFRYEEVIRYIRELINTGTLAPGIRSAKRLPFLFRISHFAFRIPHSAFRIQQSDRLFDIRGKKNRQCLNC